MLLLSLKPLPLHVLIVETLMMQWSPRCDRSDGDKQLNPSFSSISIFPQESFNILPRSAS